MRILLIAIVAFLGNHAFSQQQNSSDTTVQITVKGLCGMCKDRIETAAKGKGVSLATWNSTTQKLTLQYNPNQTNLDKIETRIAGVGHDTENKKASTTTYEALPDCCLYRAEDAVVHGMDEETANVSSQNMAKGLVAQEDKKGQFTPLQGATVQWIGSGKAVVTNAEGIFEIAVENPNDKLLVSYTGRTSDTIVYKSGEVIMVVMAPSGSLENVVITNKQRLMYTKSNDAFRTQLIDSKELFKAACCNLSESFETNPAVDVSYNDAVTGNRQIQLLGLNGNYTQLTVESMPGPRGLAMPMGLTYIPGTWIESMQLNKGTGSVVNGFESIAGQVNVELKKPETAEKLLANVYVNSMGKTDLNLNLSKKLSENWSTGLLLHDAFLYNKVDFNKDGFRDQPTGNLFTLLNRYKYQNSTGVEGQIGFKVLTDRKAGGQNNFDPKQHAGSTSIYGLAFNTDRVEVFGKLGFVFPQKKYQSIGLQVSGYNHKQDSYYGLNDYDATQKNVYANLIYQSIIANSAHKIRTGLSVLSDVYKEQLNLTNYDRTETVSGGFVEYSYDNSKNLGIVAGMRADYNNLYGWFATPRLHLRYTVTYKTTLRAHIGRGQRTANIIAENVGVLVSSRQMIINGVAGNKAYGLNPEIAWNKGVSIDHKFRLFGNEASAAVDFYRNDFKDQVVVNIEDPRTIKFENLDGKSYSNGLQAQLNLTPANNFDVRLAYRWYDIKTTYDGELLLKPFLASHRVFANLAYEINHWSFDYTVHYNSSKRIPSTAGNATTDQRLEKSPDYVQMNAQISKTLGKKRNLTAYVGGENLSNFFQHDAIIAPNDPFGSSFDASMVWGPITGRMIYGGVRFSIL